MITSCSHTFCSLCIRRYLSQEGRCPACRESDQELKLRRNWALEEVVAHFTKARDGILQFARQPAAAAESVEEIRPKKRRKIAHAPPTLNGEVGTRRSTRSQSKRTALSASQASQEHGLSEQEIPNSEDEGSVYDDQEVEKLKKQSRQEDKNTKEPNDGLVECPCCTRRMKETAINAHLDRCIQGLPTSPEPQPATVHNSSLPFVQRTKSPIVTSAKDRLPSINYALFSDASLRKKLKDLGIPNHGSKELMRKRHTEWMNLWNANCDSLKPRSKRDLLKDLDIWERTLGKQLEKTVAAGGASGVMVKDFDRGGWVKDQKNQFDDLIRKAREKKKASTSEKPDANVVQDTPMTEATEEERSANNHMSSSEDHDEKQTNVATAKPLIDGIGIVNGDSDSDKVQVDADASPSVIDMPQKEERLTPNQDLAVDLTSSPVPAQSGNAEGADTPRKRSRFFV